MRWILLFPVLLSACTGFPVLDDRIGHTAQQAPYPVLTPIPAAPVTTDPDQGDLQNRIAALQARAADLRQRDSTALQ